MDRINDETPKVLKIDSETLEIIWRKFKKLMIEVQDEFNMSNDEVPISIMMAVGAIIGSHQTSDYVITTMAQAMLNSHKRERKRRGNK